MAEPGPVFQLLGFPGTGKYTVAREIVRVLHEQGRVAKLLDNHATANLIFDLVPPPGPDGIRPEVMERVIEIRMAVLATLEQLTPPEWALVFTNFLPAHVRPGVIDRHRSVAEGRGSAFVPVLLTCDTEELVRRVVGDDRRARLKLVDPDRARWVVELGQVMPEWPDIRTLDVTALAPGDAARAIVDMVPA